MSDGCEGSDGGSAGGHSDLAVVQVSRSNATADQRGFEQHYHPLAEPERRCSWSKVSFSNLYSTFSLNRSSLVYFSHNYLHLKFLFILCLFPLGHLGACLLPLTWCPHSRI